jgi:hypothetical protein
VPLPRGIILQRKGQRAQTGEDVGFLHARIPQAPSAASIPWRPVRRDMCSLRLCCVTAHVSPGLGLYHHLPAYKFEDTCREKSALAKHRVSEARGAFERVIFKP